MTATIAGWSLEAALAANPLMERVTEAGTAAPIVDGGKFLVTIITPGRGSSGLYSAEVLERTAKDKVFPRNTQLHVDHFTEREATEHGVRSVSTLAAVLTEDAHWDGTALVAEARPIGPWGQAVREMADVIGVSISAAAEFRMDADESGAPVRVIERLIPHPLNTVDFVSVPGRGGSFQVLEAAKVQEAGTVGTYLEARTHSYLSSLFADMYGDGRLTREEWDALQAAASDAVASITATIQALPTLTERDVWQDAPTISPATEARGKPSTDPADDPTHNTTSEEDIVPKIEIDEQELSQLRESAGRADTLAQENTQLKEAAEQRETEAREARVTHAETVIHEAYGEDAPAFIVEAAKQAAANDVFDEAEAREAATALRAAEAGNPAGVGSVKESGTTKHTDADIVAALTGKAA